MRIIMTPNPLNLAQGVSGIHTLARKYAEHLPKYGIEFVEDDNFDLQAVHAGMTQHFSTDAPIVSHLHGLYWTADYPSYAWQHKANRDVTSSIRHATVVTVPSPWVAKTLQRDMRIDPFVVPHGIDHKEWDHNESSGNYVLWNKNRNSDVCSPVPVRELSLRFPDQDFVSTFYVEGQLPPENVRIIGLQEHRVMKSTVQRSLVYLSTTKETFCIGALEAMASGKPILCFNEGNITELVKHGVNGYIAECYNYDDLSQGLEYCIANHKVLGDNAREMVKKWTWENTCEQLVKVYNHALSLHSEPHDVTVVIPCYNKASTLKRAVESALNQEYHAKEIIIVNNNSTDGSMDVARELDALYDKVRVVNEEKQGVAHARNRGIYEASTRYICPLDADDEIKPDFLKVCVDGHKSDPTLGLTYTRLEAVHPDGRTMQSQWPGEYNYDEFLRRKNQVPTCCVFRRDIALRLGGYRQRYAPQGAGAEDAEFWLRFGASGFGGKLVGQNYSFRYHLGGQVGSNPNYREVDWLSWHPWTQDHRHPFASAATPRNNLAHDVPQRDNPLISIVIPVGPGHENHLINSLDSIEAQTFRKWEVIVVLDNDPNYDMEWLYTAYPYVTWLRTPSMASGAGTARNIGAAKAKADYLLFLDCDDSLLSDALNSMYMDALSNPDFGIYSDYMAISYVNEEEITRLKFHNRFVEKTGDKATVIYTVPEYDCVLAQKQPSLLSNNQFYIWNLISTLHPRSWWQEVGGFDESMPSWEDWDYWLRLSRRGKCFQRIRTPLVVYRFHTGTRRHLANPDESGEEGRQLSGKLLEYLTNKRERDEKMACGGCGGRRKARLPAVAPMTPQATPKGIQEMSADEMVIVELQDGNIGDHLISALGTSYGYRKHGDRFMMKRAHALMFGQRMRILESDPVAPPNEPSASKPVQEAPPIPEPIKKDTEEMPSIVPNDDLTSIWGVNESRNKKLQGAGVRTFAGLASMTPERLSVTIDCSESVASRIISEAEAKSP